MRAGGRIPDRLNNLGAGGDEHVPGYFDIVYDGGANCSDERLDGLRGPTDDAKVPDREDFHIKESHTKFGLPTHKLYERSECGSNTRGKDPGISSENYIENLGLDEYINCSLHVEL